MRIAVDATALPVRPGGAGYYIINLIRSLLDLNSGHDFFIFSHPTKRHLFNLPSAQEKYLVNVPELNRGLRLVWEQTLLPQLLAQLKIDVLHSPHYTMPLMAHIPVVVTFHDMTFLMYPSYHSAIKRLFFPWIIHQSAKKSTAILSVSENTRQDAIRLLGISPEKITTTWLGKDSIFSRIQDLGSLAHVREKYKLPQKFILNVSTLEPRKNQSTLLAAFNDLTRQNSSIHLVIAGGKGWGVQQLSQNTERQMNSDKIHWIGYVDREDMPGLYSLAEIFVYPSMYEGFGLPVLEAMACEVPVITSNTSSLPEIVGTSGLLIAPDHQAALAAAMQKLLLDRNLSAGLTQGAALQAAKFSWKDTAQKTLNVYEKVAGLA
jgi:glycosyltransferase involved in cell wall biosynthesis